MVKNPSDGDDDSPGVSSPGAKDHWPQPSGRPSRQLPKPLSADRTGPTDPKPPPLDVRCERCGMPKQLIARLPAAGGLGPVNVMQCLGCEIIDLMQDPPPK